MAKRIFEFCVTKPYISSADVDRITVKKTALEFALSEGEDISECIETVDEVLRMFRG